MNAGNDLDDFLNETVSFDPQNDDDADNAAAPGALGLPWQCGLCSRHAAR